MLDADEYVPSSIQDPTRQRDHDYGYDKILDLQPVSGGTTHSQAMENLPENVQPQAVVLPALRGINLEHVQSRTDLLRELSTRLPLNEYNLPLYIYRADMLDWESLVAPTVQGSDEQRRQAEALTSSIVYINYHQGFPTLAKDQPFWRKLEFETKDAFDWFLRFLQLDGARELTRLEGQHGDLLYEWYNQNYWKYRAQAYDLFTAAHHTRLREKRIFELNDKHYQKGEAIFNKIAAVISDKGNDEWNKLEIPEAVQLMKTIGDFQRKAVEVHAIKGQTTNHKLTSLEKITHENANVDTHVVNMDPDDEGSETMARLFDDPEALEQAQALILKVSKP